MYFVTVGDRSAWLRPWAVHRPREVLSRWTGLTEVRSVAPDRMCDRAMIVIRGDAGIANRLVGQPLPVMLPSVKRPLAVNLVDSRHMSVVDRNSELMRL
jgi:hypothetical protein